MKPRHPKRDEQLAIAALLIGGLSAPVHAFEFDTDDSGLKVRWDTTFKYSNAFRVRDRSPVLLASPNNDDGDQNFDKGLISNRVDVLTELDASRNGFGARLSAAGWYDAVYNRRNDNPGAAGGAFPNQASVAADQFTRTTRRLHGRDLQLLDAFTFGKVDLGTSSLSFRLGQHSLVWGESLFFGGNAIAGGMMPVDATKLLSVPNTQFKEAILPVPMASAQWQLSPTMAVAAYYQFRYKPARLPAVGSYFSVTDAGVDGGEQIFIGPGLAIPNNGERRARDGGQGGLKLSWRLDETDLALYAVRYHDKTPQTVLLVGATGPSGYYATYNENTTAYGFSASQTFGAANVAIETSIRHNQALASTGALDLAALGQPSDNRSRAAYALGKTAHFNISTIWQVASTPLWREATFTGEYAWNRLLAVTHNPVVMGAPALDPNITRDASSIRFIFEPTYRGLVTGLDLGVPLGVGYSPRGSRTALGPGVFSPNNGGDLSIGLNGTFETVWRLTATYTHYYGAVGPALGAHGFTYQQSFGDRDFIALSLARTF